jgi:dipeptidyl aminopeptidase
MLPAGWVRELTPRYPKPGTPNPLVTVHTFVIPIYTSTHSVAQAKHSLSWSGEIDPSERIITEVGWVGDDSLLVKEIDRAARLGKVIIFENGASEGQVTRTLGEQGEEGDDGWIDHVSFQDRPDAEHLIAFSPRRAFS